MRKATYKIKRLWLTLAFPLTLWLSLALVSCSTTSSLEPGEQLYTGLKPIDYRNYEPGSHKDATQEELEAALAIAPNGALFFIGAG